MILARKALIKDFGKVLRTRLAANGISFYQFDPESPDALTVVSRAFEDEPGAPTVIISTPDDSIGVNFYPRCLVLCLEWPETLASFHQCAGRSNRVNHGGFMYIAFPSDGTPADVKRRYLHLEASFRLGR